MRHWWQRRSLRLRLTIWYAITSTIILVALGGILFSVVRGRLLSELDRHLRSDFESVESSVSRDKTGDLSRSDYGGDEDAVEGEKQTGPWFEILSPSGSSLLREGPSTDWKILSSVKHLEAGFGAFSAETEGHLHVRVLENKTRLAGEPVTLRVFRPETELRQALAELEAVLGFGLPISRCALRRWRLRDCTPFSFAGEPDRSPGPPDYCGLAGRTASRA